MTDRQFINHVEIRNFKCFDSLKVEHVGRVNLLGGDNNVGKSAFLEALEIISKTETPLSLITALRDSIHRRQAHTPRFSEFDLLTYGQESMRIKTNTISVALKTKMDQMSLSDEQEIDENFFVELTVNHHSDRISYTKFDKIIKNKERYMPHNLISNGNTEFIPSASLHERELSAMYGHIVDMGRMEEINDFLKAFDSRISSLIVRPTEEQSVFKVKLRDRDIPVLLSSMGGGLNRHIAIVCAIWKCQDGCLFIDEVENGIHHTKYEKLWDILFKTTQKANCQAFVATHSKECIQVFAREAEKHDHDQIKYVNFSRTVDNPDKIVATVLDAVGLEDHFQLGLDVR